MNRPVEKEWTLRRRILGGILGIIFRRDSGRRRLRPEEVGRVLLMRYDRLGDAIVTTPVIETLHRLNDRIEIDVLAGPHNARLLEADRRISRVITWDGSLPSLLKAIRTARRRKYDLVLQLILGKTTNPAIIAGLMSSDGRIVGRGNSYNRRLFDHFVGPPESLHFADQTFGVLLAGIDFERPPTMPDYRIDLPEEICRETGEILAKVGLEPEKWVLLNASAGAEDRSLGFESGARLAAGIAAIAAEKGLRFAISGAPADRQRVSALAEASGGVPLEFPSVLHLCCAVGTARLLVTPDTGPVHIASAVGTPVVAYYSEHDKPEGWSPRGVPSVVVVSRVHRAVESVPIGEILQGVKHLLDRSDSQSGSIS